MLKDRNKFAKQVPSNVMKGMDNARNYYKDDKNELESRKWKYLILDFPSDHKLGSKEINKNAGESEYLGLNLVSFEADHPLITLIGEKYYAAWIVARTDIRPEKHGETLEEETTDSVAAQLLGSRLKIRRKPGVSSMDDEDEDDDFVRRPPNVKSMGTGWP